MAILWRLWLEWGKEGLYGRDIIEDWAGFVKMELSEAFKGDTANRSGGLVTIIKCKQIGKVTEQRSLD